MAIGIKEKRLFFRIAMGLTAAHAIEPTRALIGSFLDYRLGPVSLITILGGITGVYLYLLIKKKI